MVEVESACSSVHLLPFELPYPLLANLTVNFEFFWEKDGNPASNVTGVSFVHKLLQQFILWYLQNDALILRCKFFPLVHCSFQAPMRSC